MDEGIVYDCPWDDFRFMYFRGKDSEAAARELGAWAWRNHIHVMFAVQRVRGDDALFVLMRDKRQ